jgi:hypothetical protein
MARVPFARSLAVAVSIGGSGCALFGSYDFSGYELRTAPGDAGADAMLESGGSLVDCGTCDASACGDGGRCVER